MLISDWGSDVCSSDLCIAPAIHCTRFPSATAPDQRLARRATGSGRRDRRHRPVDRKSVVYGKSVSVRVALGGRGIYTKKKSEVRIGEINVKEMLRHHNEQNNTNTSESYK